MAYVCLGMIIYLSHMFFQQVSSYNVNRKTCVAISYSKPVTCNHETNESLRIIGTTDSEEELLQNYCGEYDRRSDFNS